MPSGWPLPLLYSYAVPATFLARHGLLLSGEFSMMQYLVHESQHRTVDVVAELCAGLERLRLDRVRKSLWTFHSEATRSRIAGGPNQRSQGRKGVDDGENVEDFARTSKRE